jgi:4-amino-4-deoxy-L-arabinose transferase-like glycosyltransferase
MLHNRLSYFLLSVIIFLFILASSAMINRPYFWDEAWSYMPAIHEMATHTPCLSPGCIDPGLYRGHPLLFYFVSSAWMKLVNPSTTSMHILALLIAVLTVISLYKLSLLVLPKTYALLSVPLLILQEVFFVQASFVLPEILLTFLLTQSLLHYILKKHFHFFIYASLMGLTKETGLILLVPFVITALFDKTRSFRTSIPIYAAALPALFFYLVQKISLGWFFYPLHVSMVDFSFSQVFSKLTIILKFIFFEQGRIILVLSLLIALMLPFLKHDVKKHLKIIGPGLLVLILLFFLHKLAFTLLILCIIGIVVRKHYEANKTERGFIYVSLMIVLVVIIFSAFNFLMTRYLLVIFPVLIVLSIMALTKALAPYPRTIMAAATFVFLAFVFSMLHNYKYKGWHDDASINYINAVRSHQEAIRFCELHRWTDKRIFAHFLMQQNMTLPMLGYLSDTTPFNHAVFQGEIPPDTGLIIFSCIELDEYKYESIRNNPAYKLIYRNELNQAWTEIYSTDLQLAPMIIEL